MTSAVCQRVRERIFSFMGDLPVPARTAGDEPPQTRGDGVVEFGKHWRVRGNHRHGVFASVSDRDDVIEFGVLERDGDESINVLHATVLLDDDEAAINCMSETTEELNFDARVAPDRFGRLNEALKAFADVLAGA